MLSMMIVDAANPPLRAIFGGAPLSLIKAVYTDRLDRWEEWQPVAVLAQG
jgi:hypothetical protein